MMSKDGNKLFKKKNNNEKGRKQQMNSFKFNEAFLYNNSQYHPKWLGNP